MRQVGSVLATISLTIPVILVISHISGQHLILGLPNAETLLLIVTLMVSITTLSSAGTIILQGAVFRTGLCQGHPAAAISSLSC